MSYKVNQQNSSFSKKKSRFYIQRKTPQAQNMQLLTEKNTVSHWQDEY